MNIVTNNPRILSAYPAARWVSGGPLEVLIECRRMVHDGYALLAHPVMGDIHLLANPFRTVILGDTKGEVHLPSLHWIEESIAKVRDVRSKAEDAESLEDYRIVDLELVRAVVAPDRAPGDSLRLQGGTPNN
jgi:hypothetical protein